MEPTLEAALAAFQRKRSAHLTTAILQLGTAALAGFTPPDQRTTLAFQRAWLAIAGDVRTRSWCLETVTTKLPKLYDGKPTPSGEKSEALVQRLAALVDVDPDPRIARAMLALFELRAPVTNFGDVCDVMATLLARHADDETAATAHADHMPEELRELDFPPPAKLTAAERTRWTIAKAAPKHDGTALWQAVLDAPDDDGPRTVLADVLQERGDPRGELIALQLRETAASPDPSGVARATRLVKEHGRTWLGALRPIAYRAELRRGFLHRIELAGRWASGKWDELLADPLFKTVEHLEAGQANNRLFAQVIASPASANLRAIEVGDDLVWRAMLAVPLARLARVVCTTWSRRDYAAHFVGTVLPFIEARPQITSVGCTLEVAPKLSRALRARLTGFSCQDDLPAALPLWMELPEVRSFVAGRFDPIELVRDGRRVIARVHARAQSSGAAEQLGCLPKTVKTVEVIGNAALARRIEQHQPRFEVIVRPLPSGLITGVKD